MLKYHLARNLIVLAAAGLTLWPSAATAADAAWERAVAVPGVIDVAGPRSDGDLVVAGSAALFLFDPASGKLEDFARGPGGYHDDAGKEAYLAISTGTHVQSANCDFAPDEIFILRQHVPFGVSRVNAAGDESGPFTNIPGVSSLTGITFDTGGAFDGRLLVTGKSAAGITSLFGVDCNGGVMVIARSIPSVEGGMAIAPSGFGKFAGALVAADTVSGRVYAIAANGTVASIGRPSVAGGPEVGVETAGFVPPRFFDAGGSLYYADARTGHLMRLTSDALKAAGVNEGYLLVAAERGAPVVTAHCDPTCVGAFVIRTPTAVRGEGHFAFVLNTPTEEEPAPTPVATRAQPAVPLGVVDFAGMWGIPTAVFVLLVAFLAVVAVQAIRRRAR
ncbi:MAG TPA: hypothetical protein VI172_13830 [Candidatus Dormibacteraeota bacterium]